MNAIKVEHLKKYYSVYKKEPGLIGSLKSVVSRKFYDVKAVDDVSFVIPEGELVGFIGPNGAGKTTTLKCLSGLLYPNTGDISVLGYFPFSRKKDFLKQITLIMGQKNQLWWDLPAIDTFLLNKEIYEIETKDFNTRLNELSTLLKVKDLLHIPVRKLSLGERMKCELIASLLHNPKILFLDEPTIGLDVVMQQEVRNFIKRYNEQFKATILLTSHYMEDVKQLCKRIIIIDHGKSIYDGTIEDIIKKRAPFKVVSIVFEKKPEREKLKKYGDVITESDLVLKLIIKRAEIPLSIEKILKEFQVEDLNIEEESIEDIIRKVFNKKENP